MQEYFLKYMDDLPNEVDIGDGFVVRRSREGREAAQHALLILPDDPKAREEAINKILLDKLTDYLKSHTLKYKLPMEFVKELRISVDEGRKKKGSEGNGGGIRMKPILMVFKVIAGILGAIALKLVGLAAFKSLLIAKIALTIASIMILKYLLASKENVSTLEVYAHPQYDDYSRFDRPSIN
ncbi:hypothetical protein NQ318_017211 [Aromia moschata]|uniref:Osiris 9 n=1 Tax=Aromia moschata TaxID=1265417 RepID=A0AAV8YKG7_9CUCU|nr:hypothetical protein NQ318_017211 [Aromia moschata]